MRHLVMQTVPDYPFITRIRVDASELASLPLNDNTAFAITEYALNQFIIPFCELEWEEAHPLPAEGGIAQTPDTNVQYYLDNVVDYFPQLNTTLSRFDVLLCRAWWKAVRLLIDRLIPYWTALHNQQIAFNTHAITFNLIRLGFGAPRMAPHAIVAIATDRAILNSQMLPNP